MSSSRRIGGRWAVLVIARLAAAPSEAARVGYTGVLSDAGKPAEGRHQFRLTPCAHAQGGATLAVQDTGH